MDKNTNPDDKTMELQFIVNGLAVLTGLGEPMAGTGMILFNDEVYSFSEGFELANHLLAIAFIRSNRDTEIADKHAGCLKELGGEDGQGD